MWILDHADTLIALLAALISIVFSILSHLDSKKANNLASKALEQSGEARDIALAANNIAQEANQISQEANELNATALTASLDNTRYSWTFHRQANHAGFGIINSNNLTAFNVSITIFNKSELMSETTRDRLEAFDEVTLDTRLILSKLANKELNRVTINKPTLMCEIHIKWDTQTGKHMSLIANHGFSTLESEERRILKLRI
ncbi:hypothetical protein B9T39_03820 [Alloscardovia macacae]|uniref:Uncharacterized protein n=1 Tax=Alloscardovia macacae TaxID=1160091 RepID=A0A1Y2T0X8_9BIFI|nr:hypothetical protein [Alloscardovia macacae]OTA29256.1 hypothetical protein B9T39_03820 [Alloscardovia macacae]